MPRTFDAPQAARGSFSNIPALHPLINAGIVDEFLFGAGLRIARAPVHEVNARGSIGAQLGASGNKDLIPRFRVSVVSGCKKIHGDTIERFTSLDSTLLSRI
jgi:hypothetical protein